MSAASRTKFLNLSHVHYRRSRKHLMNTQCENKSLNNVAFLYNEGAYTLFSFGSETIKFIAPYSLVKYEKVTTWDNGYIVVMTRYKHSEELIEEYIDLVPVLKDLYIDPDKFLAPIKKVEVKYG